MHVGLVGPLPPPSGGMAMQTLQLARLLEEEGVEVSLVQTNSPYKPRWVEKLRGARAFFRLMPYLWRVWSLCGRVDVIHLMANSGWSWQLFAAPVLWMGWLRKTPVIVNYRGGEAREYMTASSRWVKLSMKRAASLVVPSGFLQQVFSEFDLSSTIIPNIIDLELFQPGQRAAEKSVFTLAITRNLEPIYGIDTAIRALALARQKSPDMRLKIAGSGAQREELERLVDSLNLHDSVEFMGRLERKEIVCLYQSVDAVLNPTLVDNMPNSVLEALACGVPVISTDVGGVPYIVRDGETAVLVAAQQEQEMADAMLRVSRNADLRQRLSETGRLEVAQYSWSVVKPQWLALYDRLGMAA